MQSNGLKSMNELDGLIVDLMGTPSNATHAPAAPLQLSRESIPATKKLYWENTYLFKCEATVQFIDLQNGNYAISLDSTIFHPQGGGQPSDTGTIQNDNGIKFSVRKATADRTTGVIWHQGIFSPAEARFTTGEPVQLHIDEDARRLHAKLHSAGHLLDAAVSNVAPSYALKPGKGYHFVNGPYVEYYGTVPAEERSALIENLTQECSRLIEAAKSTNAVVDVRIVPYTQVGALCGGDVPDYLPKDQPTRVVTVTGNVGCPCGGTHVPRIADLGGVTVQRIRVRKKLTKINYTIA